MATKTVLVADDSASVRGILDFLLTSKGFKVRQAVHGADALDKIAESPPDLILLDAQMPIKSGFDVCATLKSDEKLRGIPVLMLTAVADVTSDTVRRMRKDLQPDSLIAKPFKIDQVIERIREMLPDAPSSSVA